MESLRIKSSIQKSLEADLIRRVGIINRTPKALETLGFWGFLFPFDNNLITNALNRFVLFVAV